MNTLITPINKVLFRSSSIGIISGGLERSELTEKQKINIQELEARKTTPKGLNEKQSIQFEELVKEKKEKGELSATKQKSLTRLTELKIVPQGLTPNQEEELDKLYTKEKEPPKLSVGAISEIKKVWLRYEKKFEEEVKSKYTYKGLQSEEDAINLISEIDDCIYFKNEERITKGHLTGEADIVTEDCIHDIKCSWNPQKFMNASLNSIYEWQLRAYMYLYNKPTAKLRYCLVDCPPEVYNDELKKFCWNKNIFMDDNGNYSEEDIPLIEQFELNYLYEHSGLYTKEERVKTFEIERCEKKEKILLESLKLAIEFYPSIKLNQI